MKKNKGKNRSENKKGPKKLNTNLMQNVSGGCGQGAMIELVKKSIENYSIEYKDGVFFDVKDGQRRQLSFGETMKLKAERAKSNNA
ncbi:MAG: hypothetical protein LBI55_00310 [Oscillospiraceae bacterium]|jgi:hypothetical protein|nr:hypothetical protein [Oscillospiraceae bacterium]